CASDDVAAHGPPRPGSVRTKQPLPAQFVRHEPEFGQSNQTRSRLGRPRARLGTIRSTQRAPETAGELRVTALRITQLSLKVITLRSPRMPYRARFVNSRRTAAEP